LDKIILQFGNYCYENKEIAADRTKLTLNELGKTTYKKKKMKIEIRFIALCTV